MHTSDLFFVFATCSVFLSDAQSLMPPSSSKQYRSDYVYNQQTDAFYKLHTEMMTRRRASDICTAEGAQLMFSTSQEDIEQVHSMFKKFPDLGDYVLVAEDGAAHESAEEHPIIDLEPAYSDEFKESFSQTCDVVTRRGQIESISCYLHLPFICKVEAKDAPYDVSCDVYGRDYTYNATCGSCYKSTRVAQTWEQAFEECRAEGAHLVVLNSEVERQGVWEVMKRAPHLTNARAHWFFFAGFRAGTDRVFRTIFNQTLEEAGCAAWSPHEPNNGRGDEYCGSLFKNDGKLNDLNCHHLFGSICEKEVPRRT